MLMALVAMGAAKAKSAPDTDQSVDVVFAPLLHTESSFAKLGPVGPFWPEAAGTRRGEVTMDCLVGEGGSFSDCHLIKETPAKVDFWPAAARMAFRHRIFAPPTVTVGMRAQVRVPFVRGAPVEIER
jgi:hypothetical protein